MTILDHYKNAVLEATDAVVVEIGAADGGDTEALASALIANGKPYRLYAFECEPKNIPKIEAKKIPGLLFRPVAISDVDGTGRFVGSGSWPYSGSLKEPKLHRISHAWIPFEPPISVETVKLDTVFREEHLDHIDFLWMDVQGAEDLVISGGQKALARTKLLYTEIYEDEQYTGQIGRVEILKRLPGKWAIVEDYGGDVLFKNLNYP